jgi:hypothetical protein
MLSLFSLSLLSSNHSLKTAMFLESFADAVCSSFVVKLEMVARWDTWWLLVCDAWGKKWGREIYFLLDGAVICKDPLNSHEFVEFVLEIEVFDTTCGFGLIL